MGAPLADIDRWIKDHKDEVITFSKAFLAIPAISPQSGGAGEKKKADFLEQFLRSLGFGSIDRINVPDPTADGNQRPNLLFTSGEMDQQPTTWFVCHLDVVPPGDRGAWTTDPFQPYVKDGKLVGRGAEDNGQALIAALFALKCLHDLALLPKKRLGIAFVADEEVGSKFGIQHLLKRGGIFAKNDLVVVPDAGFPKGDFIEIAEKTMLWMKIEVTGKQAHGSMPHLGLNAHRVGMQLALDLDNALHKKFPAENSLFKPPTSTFEPTKKEMNQENINAVPGKDVLYFDCRVLPDYPIENVIAEIERLRLKHEKASGTTIAITFPNRSAQTPATLVDSPIVILLKQAIRQVLHIEPMLGGIGGGTCGAFFREQGIPVAVYERVDEQAHKPNEYCVLEWLFDDLKIFALLMLA